jgi:PPK2 family polyphosphate:nucleotide phosphotransferase
MKTEPFLDQFRIDDPDDFRLSKCDPADTGGLDLDKAEAKEMLAADVKELSELQERLYADDKWSILIVLQAMDAAGKDGVIKHVTTGLNPQGCEVHPFKQPNAEELDHDFLWRANLRLPARGHIGIFNRSHYEEVLVVRVHPELLVKQRIAKQLIDKDIWKQRYSDIRRFERHLVRNGTIVLKFFLNVSKEEQRRRFLDRLDEPGKRWKFSMGDVAERKLWDKYMEAYEDMIRATSREDAPWFVVPADNKPFARLVVAKAVAAAMKGLDLQFPKVDDASLEEFEQVRKALAAEGGAERKSAKTKGSRGKS